MNINKENDLSTIIMTTMEQGFKAIVEEQTRQSSKISILEQELKNEARASYQAQTKEGKARYVATLKEQGKAPEKIAELLGLSKKYIQKLIRDAKKNGR